MADKDNHTNVVHCASSNDKMSHEICQLVMSEMSTVCCQSASSVDTDDSSVDVKTYLADVKGANHWRSEHRARVTGSTVVRLSP